MFVLYPAVDMRGGRCVRLRRGELAEITDYGDPVEAALRWKAAGAVWLHMVDLDGAFTGEAANLAAVARAVRETGLKIQLGGGIRSEDDAAHRLEVVGVSRVVIGTLALREPEAAMRIARRFPGRAALGLDARGGRVSGSGWTEDGGIPALDLALRMADAGFAAAIHTDIARDGMLEGPNAEASRALAEGLSGRMEIIGSGGVASLEDLCVLRDAGCSGAIIGKALYEGRFTLEEAVRLFPQA